MTSVQVIEAVIHLHERVVEDSQVSLDILHTLSMLVHELVYAILGGTANSDPLLQSLERLVRLVELDRKLELVEDK